MSSLRVVHFTDIVNRHDFIDTIIRYADNKRFQMGICVRSRDHNIAPANYGPEVPQWLVDGSSRMSTPLAALKLARILRSWKADILHTHHYDQALVGWWATRLSPRTRLVVGRHYSDAIYRLGNPLKKWTLLQLENAVNRSAERVVVPSSYILRILTERQQVSKGKIDVIPYGFEPAKYVPLSEDRVRQLRKDLELPGRLVMGSFGRLHEEKGHRYLLDALASLKHRYPDLLLLLVGDGPERESLTRKIRDLGLSECVRLLGWRKDAIQIMRVVDIVVQPTLHEAFSQVMVEALWMGRPLIITDVSGAEDVIRPGKNGLLVPRGSATALADAVRLLVEDSALRQRLGRKGAADVRRDLEISKIVRLYERSYLRAQADSERQDNGSEALNEVTEPEA